MRQALFKITCLLFLTTLSFSNLFGQEFMLNGVLMESGVKIRIALAEISNSRNRYSVGSNDMGLFQIKCMIGDTLTISKRGFNDRVIAITSTKDVIINLNRSTTLDQVTITGQSKKQTLDAIKKDFRDQGSFYAGKPPLTLLSPFGGSPLTFLYELFGRRPKNARRFNNLYVAETEQGVVDQVFNKTTINRNTGLEGKELENFMVNYRPEYKQAKNWNVYDGTKWIVDSYKNYTDTLKKP